MTEARGVVREREEERAGRVLFQPVVVYAGHRCRQGSVSCFSEVGERDAGVGPLPEADLRERFDPLLPGGVEEEAQGGAVSDGEGQGGEEVPAGRELGRDRVREAGKLRPVQVEQGPGGELGEAPRAAGVLPGLYRGEALDEVQVLP